MAKAMERNAVALLNHKEATARLSLNHQQAHEAARAIVTKSPIVARPTQDGFKPAAWASLGHQPEKKAVRETKEPKPDRSDSLRESSTCKERPTPRAGMGNSRHFVPWCDVKKKH